MCLPVTVTYFMEDYLSPFTDKILIYGIGYGISVALISVIAESGIRKVEILRLYVGIILQSRLILRYRWYLVNNGPPSNIAAQEDPPLFAKIGQCEHRNPSCTRNMEPTQRTTAH